MLLLYAHGYYDAIEQSDGKAVPFSDDCVRREGGIHTAGPRPAAGVAPPPTAPPAGQGPGSAHGSGMGSMTRDLTTQRQFDMGAAHIIKVRDRRIHEIEATGTVLPFNSRNGWSDFLR